MKKIFFILAAAAVVCLAATSCDKGDDGNPPYYQVLTSWEIQSGTGKSSNFDQIFAVTNQYLNFQFSSEDKAVAAYKDILSQTKDAPYSASGSSFVKLSITKYVAKRENEYTVRYEADPNYKSPLSHIWDAQGSRDL